MDLVKKHLTNGQYLTTKYEKRSQFLHHTISTNAMSAWRWWNSTPERVGTPQIIDRDGVIVECFPPSMWAFHLGIKGDDNWHEKHSINIELVSAGPLRLVEGKFRFYPLWPNKLHFTIIPKGEVYSFEKPWKGFKHWHAYTEDQLESLKWQIGKNVLDFPSLGIGNDIDDIFKYNPEVITDHLPGIWTHGTVREDKSDVFPYPPLIEALKEVQAELININKATRIPKVTVIGDKKKKRNIKKSHHTPKP